MVVSISDGAEINVAVNSTGPNVYVPVGPTLFIAASNASTRSKNRADYLCDGTDDQVQIQAAIDSFPNTYGNYYGGTIILSEGRFTLSAPLTFGSSGKSSTVRMTGSGSEVTTNIYLKHKANCSLFIIGYGDVGAAEQSRNMFELLHINGDYANQGDAFTSKVASITTATRTITVVDGTGIDTSKPLRIDASSSKLDDGYYTIESVAGNNIVVYEAIPSSGLTSKGTVNQNSRHWNIKSTAAHTITIEGEGAASLIELGLPGRLIGCTTAANNDQYTVSGVTTTGGDTIVTVKETIKDTSPTREGALCQTYPIFWGKSWDNGGIRGCIVEGPVGSGMVISEGEELTIEDTSFKLAADHACLFLAYDSAIQDIKINNCFFEGTRRDSLHPLSIMANGSGSYSPAIHITNNMFRRCYNGAIEFQGVADYSIIANNTMKSLGFQATDTYSAIKFRARDDNSGPEYSEIYSNIITYNNVDNVVIDDSGSGDYKSDRELLYFIEILNEGVSNKEPDSLNIHDNIFVGDITHIYKKNSTSDNLTTSETLNIHTSGVVNTEGKMLERQVDHFIDVKGIGTDSIVGLDNTKLVSATYDIESTPAINGMKYPRNISILMHDNAGGDLSLSVRVYGWDIYGTLGLWYVPTLTSDVAQTSSIIFSEIRGIKILSPTNVAAGDYVNVSYGTKFALNKKCAEENDIISVQINGSTVKGHLHEVVNTNARDYYFDSSSNSIDFALKSDGTTPSSYTLSAGDDLSVIYKESLN